MKPNNRLTTVVFILITLNLIIGLIWLTQQVPAEQTSNPQITIDKYQFDTPQILNSIDATLNFELVDWQEEYLDELLIVGPGFVDSINIATDLKTELFQWDAEKQVNIGYPLQQSSPNRIALILGNFHTTQYELWLNNLKYNPTTSPHLTDTSPSFIPLTSLTATINLGIYSYPKKGGVSLSDTNQAPLTASLLSPFTPTSTLSATLYYLKTNDQHIAYYNEDSLFLLNSNTKTMINLNLIDEDGLPLHIRLWNIERHVQWSSDGTKLALVLTEDTMPIAFSHLYLYDLATAELRKIPTDFTSFIDAVAWAPDGDYITVSAVTAQKSYQTLTGETITGNANSLFMVNIANGSFSPLFLFSIDEASHIGGILWSPDGKYIVVRYRFYQGLAPLYRVNVSILENGDNQQ